MFPSLVFLGAAVQLLGGAAYIRDTLRGTTKPNRVTWFLWMLAPYIGTAAALADGVGWAVLPVFMAGFVPMCIFLASFVNKNAYWKPGAFDYACGAASLAALALWAITKEPVVAIFLAITADGLAAVPTLVKAWRHPETETAAEYAAGLFNGLTGFSALEMRSASEYAFPLYLILINATVFFALFRKRILLERLKV